MPKYDHLQDGVKSGVDSFYRHLPLLNMRCDLDPSRMAVWWSTEHVRFFDVSFWPESNTTS